MRVPIKECGMVNVTQLEVFRTVIHRLFEEQELDGLSQLHLLTILFADALRTATPPFSTNDCDPILRKHQQIVRAYLEDAEEMAA